MFNCLVFFSSEASFEKRRITFIREITLMTGAPTHLLSHSLIKVCLLVGLSVHRQVRRSELRFFDDAKSTDIVEAAPTQPQPTTC